MQEELITFETAKLANEKGFNISCDWEMDKDNIYEFCHWMSYPNNSEFTYNEEDDPEVIAHKKRQSELLSTPTQSLLQKWLREIHNIIVEPIYNTTYNYFDLVVCIIGGLSYHTKAYPSYEIALETGLQEGLKLIKNE